MRIAVFKGRGLVSRLIRFQCRSEYSHVAILNDDGSCFEAWARGGVLLNHSLSARHRPGTEVDLFQFKHALTNQEKRKMREFLISHCGKKYDFSSVLRFLSRRNAVPDNGKLFCSEYVYMACAQANRILLERVEPWMIPPSWIPMSPLLAYSETVLTVDEDLIAQQSRSVPAVPGPIVGEGVPRPPAPIKLPDREPFGVTPVDSNRNFLSYHMGGRYRGDPGKVLSGVRGEHPPDATTPGIP